MTEPTAPDSTPPQEPQDGPENGGNGFIARALNVVERVGNLLPDPTFLFIGALVLVWILSAALSGTEYEVLQKDGSMMTKSVANQMTGAAFADFMAHMVKEFVEFHPVGVVLTAMLGLGLAEKAGFIGAGLKLLLQITPRQLLTPMLALVAVVSHTGIDAGYVIVIPIGGVLFHAVGRHPVAGIAAAFAGVSGGFSANFIPSALDPMLQGLTESGGRLVDPALVVNPLCNWYFCAASSLLVIGIIWFLTDRVIEPRLNRTVPIDRDANDLPKMESISGAELAGFVGGMAALVGLMVGLYFWATADGSSLANPEGQLGTFDAPLIQSIVPILFIAGLLPGIVHGVIAGTIKSLNDIVKGMVESMAGMGHYLVIMFFAAQFVAVFGSSGLGELLAITGADFLQAQNPGPGVTIVGVILLVAMVNLLIGSASGKWGLLSVIFVPMLMKLGYSPALTQSAYRVGDSTTNIVTPLMPYFPLVVTYCQRYVKKTGIGTLISTMLPYSLTMLVLWSAFLLLYWMVGYPLGVNGGYVYPVPE